MNVSKPRKHSLNTKKCVVNVSARYLWRDYYAEKSGSYVTKCAWRCWQLGQYIAFVECYFTSSAFVLRACFALSVSGALTVALLAPHYRWLDPQQRSKKDRF
jgi:hypothetical protein